MNILRPKESYLRKISKTLFPLWGLRAGLFLTFKHLFKRKFTVQYPENRIDPDVKFRGKISLLHRGTIEDEICISCMRCEIVCPVECIHIIPKTGEDKKRHVHIFDIDMNKCLYCNLCAECCPELCIVLDPVYDYASYSHDGLYNTIEGISRVATAEEQAEMEEFKAAAEAEKERQRALRKAEAEAKKAAEEAAAEKSEPDTGTEQKD
ncbi:MAG TPA: NADH-quinone oxidoreductase subunit I [bacterium]|jgi:NADH-quinone oxidoreductase chain I